MIQNFRQKFQVDAERSKLVVPVQFYQMDLNRAVEYARKIDPTLFSEGDDCLPSWTKFSRDPIKAKGFWVNMLEAVFLGKGNLDELNVDLQTRDLGNSSRVSMMFLSGGMKNTSLKEVVKMTEETLKGWRVLEISGAGEYNGKKISNYTAERVTNEAIAECAKTKTPLLILSRGMAQRSYSIGKLNHIYLCYENGDAGATEQKVSRGLTSDEKGKIGRIFSLSFDPNRDDKFDTMLLLAAKNRAKKNNIEIDQALRQIVPTMDIFACQTNGSVKINADTYLAQILERRSLSRVVSIRAPLTAAPDEVLEVIITGKKDYEKMDTTETADMGKWRLNRKLKERGKKSTVGAREKMIAEARKVITVLVEKLPYLTVMTNTNSIRECLEKCSASDDYTKFVESMIGLEPQVILDLFDAGWIDYNLTTLQRSAKVPALIR